MGDSGKQSVTYTDRNGGAQLTPQNVQSKEYPNVFTICGKVCD